MRKNISLYSPHFSVIDKNSIIKYMQIIYDNFTCRRGYHETRLYHRESTPYFLRGDFCSILRWSTRDILFNTGNKLPCTILSI